MDDRIKVSVSCRFDSNGGYADERAYDLTINAKSINNAVCRDGFQPSVSEICDNDQKEALSCRSNESLFVELFDLEM